jgi:hypothetical protein
VGNRFFVFIRGWLFVVENLLLVSIGFSVAILPQLTPNPYHYLDPILARRLIQRRRPG